MNRVAAPLAAELDVEAAFYQRILAFVSRRIARREDAEEITQEVFLRLARQQGAVDQTKVIPWVFTTARRVVVDHYRSASRNLEVAPLDDSIWQPEPEASDFAALAQCVEPLLGDLSQDDQGILRAVDLEGESQKDFADRKGIAYSTVKSRVQRARKRLQRVLERCCSRYLSCCS